MISTLAARLFRKTELKEGEKPVIGPGGTFGILSRQPASARTAAPAGVPAPSAPCGGRARSTPPGGQLYLYRGGRSLAPVQPQQEPLCRRARKSWLASPCEKAAGPAPELVVDANDQFTAEPAAGEGETGYAYPTSSLFREQQPRMKRAVEEELTAQRGSAGENTVQPASQTRMMDISQGPSVTRYELQPLAGVKIQPHHGPGYG